MLEHHAFARKDIFPSWWANAIQHFMSVAAPAFQLSLQDATHIQVVGGADMAAASIAIDGAWRWNETTVNRAHPGGAAGSWDIYVVAVANDIESTPEPGTDDTDYAFALRIEKSGTTPTIEAGVVDIYRLVGNLVWSGAAITALTQTVGIPSAIGERVFRPGDLKHTARFVLDAGFLKCEGQQVLIATYPELYAALGGAANALLTTGAEAGKFFVPDYRERVAVGVGGAFTLGSKGGVPTVTLTGKQSGLKSHSHTTTDPGHVHPVPALVSVFNTNWGGDYFGGGNENNGGFTSRNTSSSTTGVTVNTVAASNAEESHTNIQPYTVCNVWIKT
jgi:microcystin-dependent protein